jgi:hypothetical protein
LLLLLRQQWVFRYRPPFSSLSNGRDSKFTSSFLVPSGNLGFRRQKQQQQESRKGPTFLASSFRKSMLIYHCCQVNPEPEQTTATSVDQDASTGGLPATVPVEESGAGNSKVNGQFSESRVALSLSLDFQVQ